MNPATSPPQVVSLTNSLNHFLRRFPRGVILLVLSFVLGGGMGALTALVLYATKPLLVMLPIVALLLVIPTFVICDKRLYWFGVFLFLLQFEIQKNLNDGLAVIEKLGVDYTLWHFTFEVRATDLILAVLLFYWYVEALLKGQRWYFPRAGWLIIGFFAFCLISLIDAPSPYLGIVEISRQLKFFLLFLFAVNNVDNKRNLRLLAFMAVLILTIQGGVTALRFETGWMTPLTFGDTGQDADQITAYLSVDREKSGDLVRSFGTLGSPGSTDHLCMMTIPFALLLCMRNPMFRFRILFLGLTCFGIGALLLTFTRAYYLTTTVQILAAFLLGIRHRYLTRMEVLLLVAFGLAALGAASPKIYEQMTVRKDSVTVRLEQYKATFDMIVDNPLFGVGLNNGTAMKEHYVHVSYDERDPDTQFYLEPTHNLYLSLTSEVGLVGGMLYFAFFGCVIARAWRLANSDADHELRFIGNVILVAFAGVVVNAIYDPLHEDGVMNLLWLYSGIVFALTRTNTSSVAARANA